VVPLDAEGRFPVAKHLDLARLVGFDPDGGVVPADVTKNRAQDDFSHHAVDYPERPGPNGR
jgi:hypothetical protein